MKLSLVVPVCNQLDATRCCWEALARSTHDRESTELVVVDNGSTDGTPEYASTVLRRQWRSIRYEPAVENRGVVRALNDGWRLSQGDVVAMLHNDLEILEYGWDVRVLREFAADRQLGLAGFAGARGAALNGGRSDFYSNLREAERHGARCTETLRVALFDGMALIARRDMLVQQGGLGAGYSPHHFYDKDLSLRSLVNGHWTNLLIGVYCHHHSGITSSQTPEIANHEHYLRSERRYLDTWKDHLPIYC